MLSDESTELGRTKQKCSQVYRVIVASETLRQAQVTRSGVTMEGEGTRGLIV
jgi:hypothetical protein